LDHPQLLADNHMKNLSILCLLIAASGMSCSATSSATARAGSGDGDGGTSAGLLTTELPGRTSPYLIAEIRPQVNGLIQKRLFTKVPMSRRPGTLSD